MPGTQSILMAHFKLSAQGNQAEDVGSFFQIESKLPEHDVDGIFYDLRKVSPVSPVMQLADVEVLLNYVSNFGKN